MNICPQLSHCLAILCLALAPSALMAQRPHASEAVKPAGGTYDVANDVSLTGTILSYTENSKTPPIGAHVFLQTASGNLDVHIGDCIGVPAAETDGARLISEGAYRDTAAAPLYRQALSQNIRHGRG